MKIKINVNLNYIAPSNLLKKISKVMIFNDDIKYALIFDVLNKQAQESVDWHKPELAKVQIITLFDRYIDFE